MHHTTTPVSDEFRRYQSSHAKGNKPMSQNNAVAASSAQSAADHAAAEFSASVMQAVKSAGTEQFVTDLKKIDEVLATARIRVELPSVKDAAIHAAVVGGVITGITVLGFVATRLIASSGSSSSAG